MPKSIDQEEAPITRNVRIGIELEGVGAVTTNWVDDTVIARDNFHDVFKRTPLVRSNSFERFRGVYITPEDSGTFGKSSPAELVSSPHQFNTQHLKYLRESVKKARAPTVQVPNPRHPHLMKTMTAPMRGRTHDATLNDPRLGDDDPFQAIVATSRWAPHVSTIGGNLQTTIGVAVGKLLADDARTRSDLVNLLVGDDTKRGYTKDLLKAAISAQGYLTEAGHPLEAYAAQAEGVRLVMFMYLINVFAATLTGHGQWSKTALGANFKGYSSFIGCGVAVNNAILTTELHRIGAPRDKPTASTEMIDAMIHDNVAAWITDGIAGVLDLDNVGQPGLSMQTAVEKWFAIPNFLSDGRLFCVVEAREQAAILNIKMCEFLNGEKSGDAATFYNHVRTHTLN